MQETRRVKRKRIFLALFALAIFSIFQTNSMSCTQATAKIVKPVITIPVTGVILTPNNKEMQIGDTLNILATINPSNATNKSITWSSSNNKVATVTSAGRVTAVGYGSANIIVTTSNGKRAISSITVKKESSEQVTTTEEKTTEQTTEKATDTADTGNSSANQPTEQTTEVNQPVINEQTTEKDTQIPKPDKTVIAGTKLIGREFVYKVTDVRRKTVSCLKPVNTKKTNVVIPAYVRYKGAMYKVSAIEKYAFKNNKKIKKVVIGKNVVTIGKQAFYGCKKLKKIDIKTKKLNKVGSKAFKKIGKKPTVRVPHGKTKKYQKLLKEKM